MKRATIKAKIKNLNRETESLSLSPIVTLAHLSSEEKQKVMKLAENVSM